jgi:uncharacterized protein (TIGR02246 family)
MQKTRLRISRGATVLLVLSCAVLIAVPFLALRVFRASGVERATATPRPENHGKVEPERSAPEAVVKKLVASWNHGETGAIAGLFAPDAVLVIPTGAEVRSRSEIEKTISEQRGGMLKETILRNTVEDVSQPNGDSAVIKGKYRLEGIKLLGISTSSGGTYIFRQTKRDGRWFISRAEVLRE